MSCDVRPVITSTKTLYVNPYETAPTCPCPPARGRRCPSHGCCALDVAVHRCARRCRDPTEYNRYVRAAAPSSPVSPPRRPSPPSRPRRRGAFPHSSPHPSNPPSSRSASDPFATPHPWRRLRTFDRDPDFCAVESRDFRFALSELLDIGRVLLHADSELDKAHLRIDRERARHRAAHGPAAACERALREWWEECGWARRVAEMVAGADDLALSAEVLADCWARYVGLLRRYEDLGQRRVGGIVEDRGGRGPKRHRGETGGGREEARRDDEEAGPWRYVRRESWERDNGGGDGHREEMGARGERCRPEPVRRRRSVRFDDEFEPRRRSRDGSLDDRRHRSWRRL
ncbi:hypothetical protein LX36DRAFT_685643 [Colletotrichum falcatum]|nr:hypothetical protein LX36DRAFT_685643 [Colletotrichum falcatum]